MKKFILVILVGLLLLIPLSIYILNMSGAFNDNHIERPVFIRPYGNPIIGKTYIFNGKEYAGKKNAVIIAPTEHGAFIILDFKPNTRKETR